jgi:excisionase family DNA binding protein
MATVLTVPEAARRTKRDPETVRRWIRSGRLRATKIGTQHLIDEEELARLTEMKAAIRSSRAGR